MKKYCMILSLVVVAFSSCDKETIRGGGAVNTQERTVAAFTGVRLHGESDAIISYGPVQQVSVTGYENLVPVFETNVIGNTLHLQYKPNKYRIKNNNIRVNIVLPVLSNVHLNGSGKVTVKDFATGDDLTATINGSGNISVTGSTYNKVDLDINGSGDITTNTSPAVNAVAEIHGSGHIRLKVSNRLDASISGFG